MGNILTIAGKEVRVYLTTWMSYILFGGFILILGLVFSGAVEQFQTSPCNTNTITVRAST